MMSWIVVAVFAASCGALAWRAYQTNYWRRPAPTGPDDVAPVYPIGRVELIAGGAIATFGAAVIAFLATSPPYHWYAAVLAFAFVGYGGFAFVPVGSRGIPTFLGGRMREESTITVTVGTGGQRASVTISRPVFEVPEGISWLPPLLIGKQNVDVRERSTKVDPFTVFSSNEVRITVQQSAIRWRVVNPAQFLSVDPEAIERSLIELLQSGVRTHIRDRTDTLAVGTNENVAQDLQRQADQQAVSWGVDVIRLLIGEFMRPQTVQEDYELRTRELQQREGLEIKLGFAREQIRALMAAIPGMSADTASAIVQMAQGKDVKWRVLEKRFSLPPDTIQAVMAALGQFRDGRRS